MAKVRFGAPATPSRFESLALQRARRRAIVEQGMARSDAIRNYQSTNINNSARLQVQTTEMQLRANAQAAAKAKYAGMLKLNKLA